MFPKCRRNKNSIFKGCVFIIIVMVLMFLANQIQDSKILSSEFFHNRIDNVGEYEQRLQAYESKIIPNLGNGGKAAFLDPEEKALGEQSLKKLALNSVLSDRIPLNRTLPDPRHPSCAKITYNPTLQASIVIIFHNEILSVILRTIWSVILRTPKQMLREIVLVDDASTEEYSNDLLRYYINTRLNKYNIKLIHSNIRVGLIKARLKGAKISTGDVLIFLDAHCEVTIGWIEPLLSTIEEDKSAVLVPIIDVISESNLTYMHSTGTYFQVGGFSWAGHFTWIDVQDENDKGKLTPIKSPTMAGGLFAIDCEYFWEIGSYDDQMEGWGGENLEMSFRVWQCGGRLETVPCSRVGHIFRDFHPYKIPGNKDSHGINTARLAHVWMDDYKRLYFMQRPEYEHSSLIGDLTERTELRKRLKCKSFKWYLENVYPEKFIPDENVVAHGQIRNKFNMCLDDLLLKEDSTGPLGLYYCHTYLALSQFFSVTYNGKLRSEDFCVEVFKDSKVFLTNCRRNKREQSWMFFKNGTIYNPFAKKCLSSENISTSTGLKVDVCKSSDYQTWRITNVNLTAFL